MRQVDSCRGGLIKQGPLNIKQYFNIRYSNNTECLFTYNI